VLIIKLFAARYVPPRFSTIDVAARNPSGTYSRPRLRVPLDWHGESTQHCTYSGHRRSQHDDEIIMPYIIMPYALYTLLCIQMGLIAMTTARKARMGPTATVARSLRCRHTLMGGFGSQRRRREPRHHPGLVSQAGRPQVRRLESSSRPRPATGDAQGSSN
jgi:hypothetical protein